MTKPNTRKLWRHKHGDEWYRAKEVKMRQLLSSPWGEATAEVGTYIMTSKLDGHQIICTLDDFTETWTNDPL